MYYLAERRFRNLQIGDHKFVYLLSKSWIEKWKQYTKYE